MENKERKNSGIGAGLGALLGVAMSDRECLEQLEKHGVISKEELAELLKRVKS